MTADEILAFADRFVGAIQRGDVEGTRACYAPNAKLWHNTDRIELTAKDWLGGLETLIGILPVRRIDVVRRDVFPGFCVQQQEIVGRNAWDRPVQVRTCIVCRLSASGMIERIDEYLDSAAIAQLTAKD